MSHEIKFQDGESYEQWMGIWSQLIGDQFLEWLSPEEDQRWIDIGCGNGTFTEQIYNSHSPKEIQALDPSQEQIDFALQRIRSDNVSFQVGDAMNLPFEANRFDYATMALVLFFVPDPAAGAMEMVRVTKREGSVSAYVWDVLEGGLPNEVISAQLRQLDIAYPMAPSAEVSRMGQLHETWVDAGLNNIETKQISVHRTFDNFQQFWDITTLSPSIGPIVKSRPDMSNRIKLMTQEALEVDDTEPVTIHGFANAIKGTNMGRSDNRW
ncbi:MAG: class I SAM-dependent methyltransferase [Actinomycetota bacterium]|nr:class I SAM-dependent methyltransferase [Actinomycetota bacterium]MDG1489463.1 class I SAM-dependent methyltransferase [Actinomycetota bacterium]MDG2121449.1 class I SAM-dependent methyltransferase [Actinomycetota bacterium]NCG39815.1 methyltransferase domain-containing protein [Actinomycetota bacterium]